MTLSGSPRVIKGCVHTTPGTVPLIGCVNGSKRKMTPKNSNKNNNSNIQHQLEILQKKMKSMAKSTVKELKPVVKQALISSGKIAGKQVGSAVGMPILGEHIGEKVFASLSKAIGSGDYEIMGARANSLFSGNMQRKGDGFSIVHREYIRDITANGSGTFSLDAFDCNPGLSDVFPYLCNIANNFEEFRINGMIFEFVSTATNYSANTSLGTVICTAEYNTSATPYTSKVQMENANNAVAARTDRNILFGIECDEFPNSRYYVKTVTAAATPVNLTTPATFYVGQVLPTSIPAGTIIGELWVSYDITFYRPRPQVSGVLDSASFAHFPYKFSTLLNAVNAAVSFSDIYAGMYTSRVIGMAATSAINGIRITGSQNDVYAIYMSCNTFPNAGTLTTTSVSGDIYISSGDAIVFNVLTGSSGARADSVDVLPVSATTTHTEKGVYTVVRFLAASEVLFDPSRIAGGTSRWNYSTSNNTAAIGGDIFIHYLGNSANKNDF